MQGPGGGVNDKGLSRKHIIEGTKVRACQRSQSKCTPAKCQCTMRINSYLCGPSLLASGAICAFFAGFPEADGR
jgi:hypothetical protein